MTNEADRVLSQQARELYSARRACPDCRELVSLANELAGQCPHCGGVLLAGPDQTPERAAGLLAALQARRMELGLDPEG
jgi:hypothetical protein